MPCWLFEVRLSKCSEFDDDFENFWGSGCIKRLKGFKRWVKTESVRPIQLKIVVNESRCDDVQLWLLL
jgi:hypothetical protein